MTPCVPFSLSCCHGVDWCNLQVNVQFSVDWTRLTRDLLFDSTGDLKFKMDLWNAVRKITLLELVDKVLLPRP